MTDRPIIERLKTDLDFERTKRKSLQADLKAKEQECGKYRKALDNVETICTELLKQLKLKKQESKQVQSELIETNEQVIYLAKQLDQLKKSNEELQKENEKLKKQVCGLRPELKGLIDDTCYKYNIEVKTYHEKIVEIIHALDK